LSPEQWRNEAFIRTLTTGYKVAADLVPLLTIESWV
jgi:hypothetical protein